MPKGRKQSKEIVIDDDEDFPASPPEDFKTAMWDIMLSIKKDTKASTLRLDGLELRVKSIESMQIDKDVKVSNIVTNVSSISNEMELVKAKLSKMEATNRQVVEELDALKSYSMKPNLLFYLEDSYTDGHESRGENCVEIVRAFLHRIMGIDSSKFLITVAHRVGKRVAGKSRPILAKIPVASEIDAIMRNTNRLRDTKHFISRQMTAKQRERKQFVLPKYTSLKGDRENKASLSGDRLYVNGSLQTQYLPPILPNPSESCDIEIAECGSAIIDSGSTFYGYAVSASSLNDISDVIDSLKHRPAVASASHLIYAYIFKTGHKLIENFHSDEDHGLELLKHMQCNKIINCVFVATRDCSQGFRHIGTKRFDHVISLCAKANESLTS